MNKNFGGVIWTKHALSRMKQRGIKQGDAWVTWRRPDQSRLSKTKGTGIYYKTFGNQKIEVVAKKNDKKQWLILSVWSRRVFEKKKETIGGYLFRKLLGKK